MFEAKGNNSGYDAHLLDTWSCAIVYINMALNGGLFAKADTGEPSYERFREKVDNYWKQEQDIEEFVKSTGSVASDSDKHSEFLNDKDKPLFFFDESGDAGKKLIQKCLLTSLAERHVHWARSPRG